jgi:hypothetical protein
MILEEGSRRVALLADESGATYSGPTLRVVEVNAAPNVSERRRGVVEVERRISGHPQRALLGAKFNPHKKTVIEIQIPISGELGLGAIPTCPSHLADPLVPGFPREFADAVLSGISDAAVLGAGQVVVDRAAYDEVASSGQAFRNAAELLAILLAHPDARSSENAIRLRMRAWP